MSSTFSKFNRTLSSTARLFGRTTTSTLSNRRMSTSSQSQQGSGSSILIDPISVTLEQDDFTNTSNRTKEKKIDNIKFLETWRWLPELGPGFPVQSENVKILLSPEEFYQTLLDKGSNATTRISLASLYLGSGSKEQDLVKIIEKNGTRNNLKLKILLDFTRGSRGTDVSSRTMLLPLINNCQDCKVYLYHTPQLRGLKKRWLPQRWNEIIGLQHMKIYIFDDDVIISGANLSTDYFSNRQDRYFLIENSKHLADFYDELIDKVSDFSFQLDAKNSTSIKPDWKIHPSEGNLQTFTALAKEHVQSFYTGYVKSNRDRLKSFWSQLENDNDRTTDTWIFPLIQMGGIGLTFDKDATCKLFKESPSGSHIKLATGYFNLTSDYIDKIIKESSASYDILMAHPKANGFFGARGFAGGIPAAYTLLAKQFLDRAAIANQMYRLSMKEYIRNSWTYHAKGLWYYPPNTFLPTATLIGSPNFGHRSVYRDLETQIYLITLNSKLRKLLEDEQSHLFSFSKPFITTQLTQPDRFVPFWVRMVIMLFRNFF